MLQGGYFLGEDEHFLATDSLSRAAHYPEEQAVYRVEELWFVGGPEDSVHGRLAMSVAEQLACCNI